MAMIPERKTTKVSLHVRVLGIGLFVLVALFASALYYYNRAKAEYADDRIATKASYVARIAGILVEKAILTRDLAPLEKSLQQLLHADDELASFRLSIPSLSPHELYLIHRPIALAPLTLHEDGLKIYDTNMRVVATLIIGYCQRGFLQESSEFSILNAIIVCDLLVLFGLFLHLMLRELVTRPLENFVEATRRVAEGDLSEDTLKLASASREEDRLAVSFHEMVARLRNSREELSRVNAELEQRVTARTEELRQAKNASETVIASVAEGLYTVDRNRVIKVFNSAAEKLTGLAAPDVIGKKCFDVFNFPFCKTNCILERLQRVREIGSLPGSSRPGEEYLEEAQSDGRTWLISGSLFYDEADFTGGVETIKDLAHTRKLQQQVRQMDKLTSLGILSAGVAHEINNPLSNIKIYGQLLLEDLTRAEGGAKDSLRNILEQTDRASAIVRKMLEFSRQSQPTMEAVDMAEIVSQSLEMVRYMLTVKGIEVTVDTQPDLPSIAGSRVALQQVLINLFNNAWQAMQAGGKLSVRVWFERSTRLLHVAVEDSGTGIAESDLERIFDPFFTTKDVGAGTGLGLSISYGIINDHHGGLSVESTKGKGTTFTIVLPVQSVPPALTVQTRDTKGQNEEDQDEPQQGSFATVN